MVWSVCNQPLVGLLQKPLSGPPDAPLDKRDIFFFYKIKSLFSCIADTLGSNIMAQHAFKTQQYRKNRKQE